MSRWIERLAVVTPAAAAAEAPAGQPPAPPDTLEYFEPAQITKAAEWSAKGFVLLAAILTFLGLEGGALERVLRNDGERVTYAFLLLGLGVVAGILTPALKATRLVYVRALLGALVLLGLVAIWVGRHDGDGFRKAVAWAGIGLLVAALVVFRDAKTSIVGAALVFAVTCTSMGLYAASVAALQSTQYVDQPRVTAALKRADTGDTVEVSAKAARRADDAVVVVLLGHRTAQAAGEEIARQVLHPDGAGGIDATVQFPVSVRRWAALSVGYCVDGKACPGEHRVAFRTDTGSSDPQVGAAVVPDAKGGLDVTVTAAGLRPGTTLRVEVERLRGRARQPYVGVLVPNGAGAASWASKVGATKPGDVVVVRYVVCETTCPEQRAEVARYGVG